MELAKMKERETGGIDTTIQDAMFQAARSGGVLGIRREAWPACKIVCGCFPNRNLIVCTNPTTIESPWMPNYDDICIDDWMVVDVPALNGHRHA